MSLVAIVGRPNVGKSTLFNRLVESREAIVHDEPGVTRDRLYGESQWNGFHFNVVDTGGYVPNTEDRFESGIREQVKIAIQEADVLLYVVDVTTGITSLDESMATILRRADKPVFIVANKADNDQRRWLASEFYSLGLDSDIFPVSSISGSGTGEMLDAMVKSLPTDEVEAEPDSRTHVAFIGRPNVGKSSATNALLGTDRSIVTEISGTTRDSIDSPFNYNGEEIVLVDTAGLRRKAKVKENVEFYSTLRTERAVQKCDVAVLLIDAKEGLESQDLKVLSMAEHMKKGLVIAVNKWDLVEDKETNSARDYEQKMRDRIGSMDYVPIIFISALTNQRITKMLDLALAVAEERKKRIPTNPFFEVIAEAVETHYPPTWRGNYVKIKFASQVRVEPPVFAFFCNHPKGIKENYRRYLENKIRESFDFNGVPLTLVFKQK